MSHVFFLLIYFRNSAVFTAIAEASTDLNVKVTEIFEKLHSLRPEFIYLFVCIQKLNQSIDVIDKKQIQILRPVKID